MIIMLEDFFKPLKEPVESYWEILPICLFISLISWGVSCLSHSFLVWLLSLAFAAFFSAIIYCLIKKNAKV